MRKSLLLLAALVPIAGIAGISAFALPAAADSDDGSCAAQPALQAGPLNLDAIPTKPVTGPLSVRGAGDDDDCDDGSKVAQEQHAYGTVHDSEENDDVGHGDSEND